MSERSGQTAKGKDGKAKYASLNLFDTYKGKSLEAQKPVVPARHGLQSLGKVASARRMPPPASLPSLKAENKGNDPNVTLVPKDGTGWASKQEPADPKSTDVLSAAQPESPQPVVSQTPAPTRSRTPPAPEAPAPALAQGAGARSWAQASVTHGAQGDGGKGSNQPSPFSREEFPTLQAAGDQDRAGREQATADQLYGPGPSLRPQNVTSWRDGGGRGLAPTEGVAEGGSGGVMVMEGAFSHPQQNSQAQGPPRNPPAGSPALPLPQPPVGPGFPQYRGMMPPFMYPPYLPFPPPYGPQGPYRFPPPGEAAPRFSRSQGGPDGRPHGGPRGEVVKRPSILKQNDLKELDELDHDGDEGWAGPHEEIDYSAKLKFSDDEGDGEEDGDEDRSKTKNGTWEQQRSPDGPPLTCRSRASDSGGDSRHTPPSSIDSGPPSTPGKPGWTEEGSGGGVGWVGQGGPANHQERPQSQLGSCPATQAPGKPAPSQATPQPGGPVPPPQPGLLAPPQGEDEDETWRQRRKQSSSEISAAVERARRRREEEERRMEEERRAACAEKLKRLDEKHQQQGSSGGSKTPSLDGNSTAVTAGSPSPSLSASASSPNVSQPVSPCVDPEELPLLAVQQPCLVPGGSSERQRASSNSSYDSNTGSDSQQCALPPAVAQQQPQPPVEASVTGEGKDETLGGGHLRSIGGGVEPVKAENMGGGAGRQASGPPGQGYSKYQKSLPPRFQRQQQEQLLKQQQWQQQQQQQQQQQHSQASQGQLPPQGQAAQAQQQGPSPGSTPQPGPGPKQGSGGPLYQGGPIAQGNMGRPPPLPMNFDPRWMMMPYMDPRMMQGRPPPMDYYAAGMHPSGMMGRERSDSGGSGSDPFDRQQHPGHPHRGTPPMDPKLAWGPEVFPGGGEGRGLTSPLRQKQPLEEDDMAKGPRSDTPPHRHRDGGPGPIQQPSSGPSNQNTAPVSMPAGGHPPHHHHHPPYMGGRGNYSNFPEQGSRMAPHQQQQRAGGGERGGMGHQEDGPPRGSQQHQGQIWGAPHPHYDRNGRAELSPLESNSHQQQHAHHQHGGHQQHPAHTSHYPLHSHKPENGRERAGDAPVKKAEASSALHQPSISSSCSSSSSSSSAREDGSGKTVLQHHLPPQREAEIAHGGSSGHAKQDKAPHSTQGSGSSLSPAQHGGHAQVQQQPHHPKNSQRGREHKTETQWGPRPGNNSNTGGTSSSHNRRANSNAGVVSGNTRGGDDLSNMLADHKVPGQSGGSVSGNKRAGPIKRPVQKDMKREGAEGEGPEKPSAGKEMEQDSMPTSKQDALSATTAPFSKDEPAQPAKSRNGRERGGGSGRGPKVGDNAAPSLGYSRRERERSLEKGGGGGGSGTPYHHGVSARGSGRVTRGRGGEFYGRGRGYRGGYVATANAGSASRGRASGRSGRDYRSSTGSGYQEFKSEVGGSRHGPDRSQHNPARARNRSETRSEGSEYEEIPKRRRQRGSETGSESAASDLAQSDKEDRKPSSARNGSENAAVGSSSATPLRGSQARVFTPRGVPSRRGRGGGGGGGIYRGAGGPMAASQRSAVSTTSGWSSKTSTSVRKPPPLQSSRTKDMGRGGNGGETKAKDKAELITPTPGSNPAQSPQAAGAPTPQQSCAENGVAPTQLSSNNSTSTCSGPNLPLSGGSGGGGGSFPPSGFERPPRRRRHGRSQHQQDKPPRFRRLKERENAARINGSVGVIGGGRPSSPSLNSAQDTDGAPTMGNANHTATPAATNNNSGSHLGNANSHHHHHYSQGNSGPTHHHNHNNPAGGAKSPDFSNQNSDQANEEWETASESSDFTEFREREGGGGGGKSYSSHHHHHPQGRGAGGGVGGGTGEREMTSKESAANKRSFSSQRPGMERQNRRVNTGGGGGERRGPRGPPGGGTGGGGGNGGGNRSERRGNWPSPKNRK